MFPEPMFQFFLSASFQGVEDLGRGIPMQGALWRAKPSVFLDKVKVLVP